MTIGGREESRRRSGVRGTATGLILAAIAAAGASAQSVESGRSGPRPVLPRAAEIALARSAAPAAVSGEATVLAWTGTAYETAEVGSNGVTCYVARDWPESLEPHCFDEEGSRTILRVHLLQAELRAGGASEDEIDARVADALRTGELRLPSRPAMSYMMSAGQKLVSDEGQPVGAWKPHVMIYYPYLTSEGLGLGSVPSTRAAVVVDPGTPFSNMMVVVEAFVPVEETEAGR